MKKERIIRLESGLRSGTGLMLMVTIEIEGDGVADEIGLAVMCAHVNKNGGESVFQVGLVLVRINAMFSMQVTSILVITFFFINLIEFFSATPF